MTDRNTDRRSTRSWWDVSYLVDEEDPQVRLGKAEGPPGDSRILSFQALGDEGGKKVVGLEIPEGVFKQLHATTRRNVVTDRGMPAIDLFRTLTRRVIIPVVLENMSQNRYDTQITDIRRAANVNKGAIREYWHVLKHYGIIQPKSPGKQNPYYRLTDSRAVDLLESLDDHQLLELFGEKQSPKRVKLVRFFLTQADHELWYSRYKIAEEADIGYGSITNNIDDIANTGFLRTREPESERTDREYRVNLESPTRSYLFELNQALWREYTTRYASGY